MKTKWQILANLLLTPYSAKALGRMTSLLRLAGVADLYWADFYVVKAKCRFEVADFLNWYYYLKPTDTISKLAAMLEEHYNIERALDAKRLHNDIQKFINKNHL